MSTTEEAATDAKNEAEVTDIVLPTYHTKPEANERFFASKARAIAKEILEGELKGKVDEKWVEEVRVV